MEAKDRCTKNETESVGEKKRVVVAGIETANDGTENSCSI
jgi:hypothetical protein